MSQEKLGAALGIIARLETAGHRAVLAGGCVRDLLLGRRPQDFDVATSAHPQVVLDLFPRTFAVGAHFGVVLVADEAEDGSRITTEVATFRTESSYTDGRHPDAVRYAEHPEEDVQRRDFTINGLLLEAGRLSPGLLHKAAACEGLSGSEAAQLQAAVLDFVGGVADLRAGLLRAIGEPARRFDEDRLRLLRAVRFAARLGFAVEPLTMQAIRAGASGIAAVSRERVRDELTKMLVEGGARRAFELLDETGLLGEVLPEVARMKGVEQPAQFHPEGDVWQHTLKVLGQLEPGCSMTLGWGALLHDVGKPATMTRTDRIRFNGHAEVGARMAEAVAERFRFSNEERCQVVALVANHMRFVDVQRMKESTLRRFFRLEEFEAHLLLHKMDSLAARGVLENWEYARKRFAGLSEEEVRPRIFLTGRSLLAAGYKAGPKFKEMLEMAEDAQLEGRVRNEAEALALMREFFPMM